MKRRSTDVVVVGGGIAGIAAATALVEQGVDVTLLEAESFLGGRAAGWSDTLADGESFQMERGFHAFFRQYYSLRSLLRRVDPDLSQLEPLDNYPILGPEGARESFSNLPKTAPFNVIELTRRTKTLGVRDLMKVDIRAALRMLAYDGDATYERYDTITAGQYLDALKFPPDARRMLFDVFAHSFFNPEEKMSAGELLMMFHFYFMRNREGLVFDVAKKPMSTAFWNPLQGYLESKGATLRLGESASAITQSDTGWCVESEKGSVDAKQVVLALSVPGLKKLLERSPALSKGAFGGSISDLKTTSSFAVWRLWLDKPTRAGRQPFVGTSGMGAIDNVSLYHLFQDESREWAERRGGSVVELHAYALLDGSTEASVRRELMASMHALYPETKGAKVIDERFMIRQDCPAFECGSYKNRPGVTTPLAGVFLAGDFVKLPFPSALMERAAASGFSAANQILEANKLPLEHLETLPNQGLFAPLMNTHSIFRPHLER